MMIDTAGIFLLTISLACSSERVDLVDDSHSSGVPVSNAMTKRLEQQGEWQVVRLSAREFAELPQNIADDIERRGCLIPQVFGSPEKHNVISGEFARKGRKDWAVLCSKNEVTSILIFWDGLEKNVSDIYPAPESNFMQDMVGDGTMGFSRAIDAVGEDYILDHYKAYGGLKPPKIEHDGIDDAYVEKASSVHYLYRGKWLELQGAD